MKYTFERGLIKDIKNADDGRGMTYSASYIQVVLNTQTGRISGYYHNSIGHNEWTNVKPPTVSLGNYAGPITRKQLAHIADIMMVDMDRDV